MYDTICFRSRNYGRDYDMRNWIKVSEKALEELAMYNDAVVEEDELGKLVTFYTIREPEPEYTEWDANAYDTEDVNKLGHRRYRHLRFTATPSLTDPTKGDDITGAAEGDMSWYQCMEAYGSIPVHWQMFDPQNRLIRCQHLANDLRNQ